MEIYCATEYYNGIKTILFYSKEDARNLGQQQLQLLEGCEYEYLLSKPGYMLDNTGRLKKLVFPNRISRGDRCDAGRIRTGIFVGVIELILVNGSCEQISKFPVEIRSLKLGYRDEYRIMLEEIAEECIDLLTMMRSPTFGRLVPDPGNDSRTIGQRFAFIQSILCSRKFYDAIDRITLSPHETLERTMCRVSSHHGFRPSASALKQISNGARRLPLDNIHPLYSELMSIPEYIYVKRKKITIDTPENRFVKFALQAFLSFLNSIRDRLKRLNEPDNSIIFRELALLMSQLEATLSRPFFLEISEPQYLPLGSPVLQRKEGYTDILRTWLYFDAAARLIWEGGDDVYLAGRRDVAKLYEYWLFFKLLDIVGEIFNLPVGSLDNLIEKTHDNFGLKLKSGHQTAICGIYSLGECVLNIRLSYNRIYSHREEYLDVDGIDTYPSGESWTEPMIPDYTLTLWPQPFAEDEAEEQELIVHVHFDAKYSMEDIFSKYNNGYSLDDISKELIKEKLSEREGKYRRADLYKMHTYKDAIRRTAGSYILYPGQKTIKWKGFHEILPGIGAFAIRPTDQNNDGSSELKAFILQIARHVANKATHRDNTTYQLARIQSMCEPKPVYRNVPVIFNGDSYIRNEPPQEINVLIVEYNHELLDWTKKNNIVLIGMNGLDSVTLTPEIIESAYIILTMENKGTIGLFKVAPICHSNGPTLFSAKNLARMFGYIDIRFTFFLVFHIDKELYFADTLWDINEIRKNSTNHIGLNVQTIKLDVLLNLTNKELCK